LLGTIKQRRREGRKEEKKNRKEITIRIAANPRS